MKNYSFTKSAALSVVALSFLALTAVPVQATVFSPNTTAPVRTVGVPQTISIPKLKVSTVVETKRLNSKGIMEAPSTKAKVAWYKYSVRPGESGNAVISGHLNSFTGPGVFRALNKLKLGDAITIKDANKKSRTFKVSKIATYKYEQAPITSLTKTDGPSTISLVTCAGTWSWLKGNYSHRLIVTATLVK